MLSNALGGVCYVLRAAEEPKYIHRMRFGRNI